MDVLRPQWSLIQWVLSSPHFTEEQTEAWKSKASWHHQQGNDGVRLSMQSTPQAPEAVLGGGLLGHRQARCHHRALSRGRGEASGEPTAQPHKERNRMRGRSPWSGNTHPSHNLEDGKGRRQSRIEDWGPHRCAEPGSALRKLTASSGPTSRPTPLPRHPPAGPPWSCLLGPRGREATG